jgi:xylose isomerase
MDAKTLEKMTVVKLREEAMKFDDIVGAHGMDKDELLVALKEKYGIHEDRTESELLIERKHAMKKKIAQLKAEKAAAIEAKDAEKTALIRRRLRRQRRNLKKVLVKAGA